MNRMHPYLELAALVLALVFLGAFHFSQVTLEQQQEIELEAGLEQLYLMEKVHFEQHGRYFDPTDPQEGLEWQWMESYDWDFRTSGERFWLVVRADLNGDGQFGVWGVDDRGPQVQRLMQD
ncbi:MAG: hypothetical protein HOC74_09185 [Gemmatimonadetes bacterium]|jgi:hypothetical protein|nr:hypothetical protein [Gemmatimonadota bacterium]